MNCKKYTKILTVLLAAIVLFSSCKGGQKTSQSASSDILISSSSVSSGQVEELKAGDNDNGVIYYQKGNELVYPYGRIVLPFSSQKELFGIKYKGNSSLWSKTSTNSVVKTQSGCNLLQTWKNDGKNISVTTDVINNKDGSMSIKQNAKSSDAGISSLVWGLEVPDKYELIIPAYGGIRLNSKTPDIGYNSSRLEYPNIWESQMFLIQGPTGGLLVYADDNGSYFKALNVKYQGATFSLGIETVMQAPFDNNKEGSSVEWKMVPYEGNWVNGGNLYRKYADNKFGLTALNDKKLSWSKNIQLTLLTDIEDLNMLKELSKKVIPSQTLLVVPGWRNFEYDTNFPDYTEKPLIADKIKSAQAMGYKVALYVNLFGVDPKNPEYKTFKPYQIKDPYTDKPLFLDYVRNNLQITAARINPASSQWRAAFIKKMKAVVNKLKPDALHIDESLLCFNDANGLLDGMTTMQGNVQLHKDLIKALPNIAISGEGLNEINVRYSSIVQKYAYGVEHSTQSFQNNRIQQILPLTSIVLGVFTTQYGHADYANPQTEDYYVAWYRATNSRLGLIPTLTRNNYDQIVNPSPLVAELLTQAKWYQINKPRINTGTWSTDALLSMTYGNGKIAEFQKDLYGEIFVADAQLDKSKQTILSRIIYGTSRAKLPGTIKGWQIYDKDFIFGLDPAKAYHYINKVRSLSDTHIYSITNNITVNKFSNENGYSVVNFRELNDFSKNIVNLLSYPGPMRTGEIMDDGTADGPEDPFNSLGAFNYTFKNNGTVQHWGDRALIHPPWNAKNVSGFGYSWLEFDVDLKKFGSTKFEAGVQIASAENTKYSDGVEFRINIWAENDKTNMVTYKQFTNEAVAKLVSLDLTKFEGKRITIRVETHPGGTTKHDSAVLVEPKVIQKMDSADVPIRAKITTKSPIIQLISTSGKTKYTKLSLNNYSIDTYLSDTMYIVTSSDTSIKTPQDLTLFPYSIYCSSNDGGEIPATGILLPVIQVADVKDDLKQGFFQHPPNRGKSNLTYVLKVPSSGKTYITGFTGMKKGSDRSNGVGFRILANGKEIYSFDMKPTMYFKSFEIPISSYAGKTIVLTFVTDSLGDNSYDFAFWADPMIVQK